MTTLLHEAILELIAAHPEVLLPVLHEQLGELPRDVELRPSEPFMDQAWRGRLGFDVYLRGEPEPLAALTVQAQLEKDEGQPFSWLIDHTERHMRRRVPAYLVVVAGDPAVASWAAGPFVLGTLTMRPWVITLVELLEARGISLDPLLREQLGAGTDLDLLAQWLRRANG